MCAHNQNAAGNWRSPSIGLRNGHVGSPSMIAPHTRRERGDLKGHRCRWGVVSPLRGQEFQLGVFRLFEGGSGIYAGVAGGWMFATVVD